MKFWLLAVAFGSAATDVSAFWLKKSIQNSLKNTLKSRCKFARFSCIFLARRKSRCKFWNSRCKFTFLQRDFEGLDAFGSAATDVSAFWLNLRDLFGILHVLAKTLKHRWLPSGRSRAAVGQESLSVVNSNLQRDFKEFATGCDAFGSAATDVSAFWLK